MDSSGVGAASAIAGVAVFSIHSMYAQHAGSLADCRNAPAGDVATLTRIRDADILTGSLVLVAGGTLVILTKKKTPLVIAGLAFAVTSTYYHLVCHAPNVGEANNGY